ncbi:MAG TPA: SDR family NAD(P)-dependent oxidoreductase [Polyangiaceae bacterium]|nr:SDR family NAD(P)-dependent oxidoreductase [Polyangiaceae bacterium]
MELRGRWVLVTGASSGLGREMAKILAVTHGANLLISARREDRLLELKAELEKSAGVKVDVCVADLSKLEDVDRLIETATKGRALYGAVLNAGITHFGAYAELSWESFRTMLDTNVIATVRMSTALIPALEAQGGGLMIVSSMAGIHPVPFQTHYSGTKAFLVHFGVGLWHELVGRNVSVTVYAPSGVVSEMTAGESFTPLRRWLMPVEQAASEGVEAFRARKYLHISGFVNRVGSVFARILPQRFSTGLVAAQYRSALKKQGSAS